MFYILLVYSFFYSQGSYIYSHIHSLYNGSVIFVHSDMFIQPWDIITLCCITYPCQCLSTLLFISSRHLVKVTSFVFFWDGCEGGRIVFLKFGRGGACLPGPLGLCCPSSGAGVVAHCVWRVAPCSFFFLLKEQ